ncbi:MAG: aldehyde dehydrogenase family protein [Azospirillaceae bacterium]
MSFLNPNTAIPEAAAGPRPYGLLIDGRWVEASDGRTLERVSPSHGIAVSRYALAGVADAERAIAAGRRAFDAGPWPRMSGRERGDLLLRTADLLIARSEELARLDVLESGKPITQAQGEIGAAIDMWRYAAALARDVHGESYASLGEHVLGLTLREPVGLVSIITPWNFPFLIVSQKLPFALAAGCTAVVKPSELTSASTLVLGEVLLEAGLPPGVVNIVVGHGADVGARLVDHPAVDMISFTGSTLVGRKAVAAGADTLKRVSLELGGKNGQIVFADCDLDAALDAVLFGAFFNAGECCNAGSRLIIERAAASAFLDRLVERSHEINVGDPLDPDTLVGAIITDEHLDKIEGYVNDAGQAGARVALGGSRVETRTGRFMAPTIVDGVSPGMRIAREEVFGPVLSVLTFESAEEAVRIANDTDYGLSAGVWSRDIDTCIGVARGVRTGTVWVNTFMDGHSELPFGGYKQSGLGRELGRHAVTDYTETKTVQIHRGPRTNWWLPRGEKKA